MRIVITGLDLSDVKQVLLLAPETLTSEDLFQINQELHKRFPSCQFVLLSGDFQVVAANKRESAVYEIES